MKNLIRILKNLRKQNYLKLNYKHKYAFVGIGNHSIHNLYPIINYYRLPVKYIVVKSKQNANLISQNFYEVHGTTDFDKVLSDQQVVGVFICTDPNQHFSLSINAIEHGKHVFVEKPPAKNIEELLTLSTRAQKNNIHFMIGLQKRYAPAIQILRKHISSEVLFYSYRYCTGSYIEGNPVFDLFIHAIDLVLYIFGEASIEHITKASEHTFFLQLCHKNGLVGNIELSADYSWNHAHETLTLNTKKGIYILNNLEHLEYELKPTKIFSFPTEKVFPIKKFRTILFEKNSFLPTLQNNTLYTAGYFSEIQKFINLCEKGKGKNLSHPKDVIHTYEILEQINKII